MACLIDKDVAVAEIERKRNICQKVILDLRSQESKVYYQGKAEAYKDIIDTLDTLEVKEVDLMMHTIIAEGCDWLALHTKLNHNEIEDCRNLMLTIKDEQLKAQKRE